MTLLKQGGAALFFTCCIALFFAGYAGAEGQEELVLDDGLIAEGNHISDPLEPINRVFFQFNDKFYFWVLKPVSKSYAAILPDDVRMCIGNVFDNITAPIRIVNNLLQGKVGDSGTELARFVINTIAGAGGLGDPAKDVFNLNPKEEDLGQTFGKWGIGDGIYICWPFLGPSNVRDSVGFVGDAFLSPLTYLSLSNERAGYSAQAGQKVNSTSMTIGDYEQFKEASFDPYTAMRDFYLQSRRSKIADKVRQGKDFSSRDEVSPPQAKSAKADSTGAPSIGIGTAVFEDSRKDQVMMRFSDLNNVEKMIGHSPFGGIAGVYDTASLNSESTQGAVSDGSYGSILAGLVADKRVEKL